jgi:hypothetical protein
MKYLLYALKEQFLQKRDGPSTLVVEHSAGFFSCCSMRLFSIMEYWNRTGVLPEVDSSKQWTSYCDKWVVKCKVDLTSVFFKQRREVLGAEGREPIAFSSDGRDQFGNYANIHFSECRFLIDRYFSPSAFVLEEMSRIEKQLSFCREKTCAVIYRGNDKSVETNIPSPEEFVERARLLRREHPEIRFWIQSDELEFYQCFKAAFPDSLDLGLPRMARQASAIQYKLRGSEKTAQAIRFLAVLKLMGQCEQVIINSGNVGMWCCLFRGGVSGVQQYLSPKSHIYGVPNPDWGVFPAGWIVHGR